MSDCALIVSRAATAAALLDRLRVIGSGSAISGVSSISAESLSIGVAVTDSDDCISFVIPQLY